MKHFQQNLLIILALALCGLCVCQWSEQTRQRNAITTLNVMVYQKNIVIQDATNSLATLNHQVDQMGARLTQIKAAAATNDQLVRSQKAEIVQWRFTGENLTNQLAQYQTAVDTLTSRLKDAYTDISRQNSALTNLIVRRDDLVKQYNDSVQSRNEVVTKYNDLVNQVQKQLAGQK